MLPFLHTHLKGMVLKVCPSLPTNRQRVPICRTTVRHFQGHVTVVMASRWGNVIKYLRYLLIKAV